MPAKVLHRKRPWFIPIYDERVRTVYQDEVDASVPPVKDRSWADVSTLFAQAVRADLERELPRWDEIAACATGPAISPLRTLDILFW